MTESDAIDYVTRHLCLWWVMSQVLKYLGALLGFFIAFGAVLSASGKLPEEGKFSHRKVSGLVAGGFFLYQYLHPYTEYQRYKDAYWLLESQRVRFLASEDRSKDSIRNLLETKLKADAKLREPYTEPNPYSFKGIGTGVDTEGVEIQEKPPAN